MSDKLRVVLVMLCAILCAATGEALAAKGMKQTEGVNGILAQIGVALRDWHVVTGWCLMASYVCFYIYALSLADLSLALPLSAASYLLGLGFAKFYLHEDISPSRLIGTAIIIAGVLVVAIGGFKDGTKDDKGSSGQQASQQGT